MINITGLTSSEVERLTSAGKTNKLKNTSSRSVKEIIRSNIFTFFNLLHILLFAALLLVGAYRNMLFMLIIIINSAIGTIQEIRAKRTIDRLTVLISPDASVIRDGKETVVATDNLVAGDVVIFKQGAQICADCVILDGSAEVNEALLTGESEPVKKNAGDKLLSGSFISSGHVITKLEKVGAQSYAAKLTADAKRHKKINSEILNALNKIIKIIGFIILPIGIVLFVKDYSILGQPLTQAVSATVAALVSMIPDGLYLLTSIALAVSVIRLGKANTLVREMYAIEQLARVDVLCIDKTGTITSGDMQINEIESFTTEYDIYKIMANINNVLTSDSSTQIALENYFGKQFDYELIRSVPFSSQRKWQGCVFKEGCFVCGAPEFILEKADGIEKYTQESKRVLVLVKCELDEEKIIGKPQKLAYIIIEDQLRPNVKETFNFFADNNVDIKVISGDNPVTVSAIAARAGIKNSERYIDMSSVEEKDIIDICDEYNVFGRVSPTQKKLLVNCLKSKNHTVAMTGDGVNDVLALKSSDCSIAMAQGSEAARRVSTLVLTNSDFSSMPNIVLEGRRVINNIQRTASLFLVKTIFSAALSVLLLFLPMSYPLQPIQVTLFGSLTIGIPAFFLALRSNKNLVKGNFLKNVMLKALPSGICVVLGIMTMLVYNVFFPVSDMVLGTMSTLFISFIGFLTLFKVCLPFDKRNIVMFGLLLSAFVFCITLLKKVFYLVSIPVIPFLLLLALMAVSVPLWLFISNLIREKKK
ncbi:MAG: ATPase P [Clostridiales bacterium]|nr:MAG: ATPase P [Clostridiales bacterium]